MPAPSRAHPRWRQAALWKSEIGRNTFQAGRWAISARLVGGLGRLLRSLVLARLLAPSEFGLAALAVIAIETLDTCTAPGLEPALIQRTDESSADVNQAFTIQLVRGAGVALLAWAAAPLVAAWFDAPRLVPVMRWLTALPLLRALSNPGTVELVRRLQFGRLFFWETADLVAAIVAGVTIALVRPDVAAIVGSVLAGQGTRTLLSWMITGDRAVPRFDPHRAAHLLRYGGWVLAANVLMLLNVQGEHALAGAWFGPAALGIYQMGTRIAELPITLLAHPLVQVAFPALAQVRQDSTRFTSLYWSVAGGLVAACAGWLVLMGPLASALVMTGLGPLWLPSVPILRIVLLTTLVRSLVVFGQAGFYAVGRPDLHVRVNAVRLVGAVAVAPLLVPALGLRGIAWSVLAGTTMAAAAQVWLMRTAARRRELRYNT